MTNIFSPQKCKKKFFSKQKASQQAQKMCSSIILCPSKEAKSGHSFIFCDQNFRWTFLFIVIMKNKNSTSFSQKILKILVERCKKGGYNMKSLTHNYYIIII